MKTYPHLTQMGVLHPDQIEKYSVNSIAYTDVLRIVYKRPKGSILPVSRTYKFPRVQKPAMAGGGASQTEFVMESAPALRAALDELADLTKAKKQIREVSGGILEELRLLEEDVALRSECIKELVGRIKVR